MAKSISDCWREEQVKARLAMEESTRMSAKRSERIGRKMGVVGVNIAHDHYHRTITNGMMRIVEDELPEAKRIGKATATQILNERRKTLLGYLTRFVLLSLTIGALCHCLALPLTASANITISVALIGAFLTDPKL